MKITRKKLTKVLITLIGAAPFLSACGGGNGDLPAAPASAAPTSSGNSTQGKDCNAVFLLLSLGTLCVDNSGGGSDCSEAVVTNDVYIMLFDQSQTTIAHSDIIDRSTRMFSVNLTAGLAYYAEVHAFD